MGVIDSANTCTSIRSLAECARASDSMVPTRLLKVASSAARASSQALICEGIALAPLGRTCTLPNVATASCSEAAALALCTDDANASMGSRRSTSRVAPAWFASPVNVNSQGPVHQIECSTLFDV